MTKHELSNLNVYNITFQTEAKNGKVKYWTTSYKVDHAFICDHDWNIEDFEEVSE